MDSDSGGQPKLSKLRSLFFPIYNNEIRKFIPMLVVFLCISFIYASTRILKDSFVLASSGAETLYFLKMFFVLPMIILYTIFYTKIAKSVNRDTRFNIIAIYFAAFFILSYTFLFPYCSSLQLDSAANYLNSVAPRFKGLWAAIQYWPCSLFYFHAEAWGTLMLSISFWSFANEITSSEQAKRFYSFLSLGAAIGSICAGRYVNYLKGDNIKGLGFICLIAILMVVVYNLMAKDIRKNPNLYQVVIKAKKKKMKMSMWESLKFICKSKYLALISIIVLSYNSFISLFESTWKDSVKEYAKIITAQGGNGQAALNEVYAQQMTYSGILQFLLIFFVASFAAKKTWKFSALLTPVVALFGVITFTCFLKFQAHFIDITKAINMPPIYLAVMVGCAVLIFIKAAKYVFFDTTKERAFIPLDEESKLSGKAAVDAIGSRLGKSLGSAVITLLVPIFGSISQIRGITTVIIVCILVIWIYSVCSLSKEHENKLIENQKQQEADALHTEAVQTEQVETEQKA